MYNVYIKKKLESLSLPGERLYEDLDSFGIFFFPTSASDINFLQDRKGDLKQQVCF